ncbi:MAG: zinc dependent phospholipase C family protein, partial [Anaerolineales bacterium]
SRFLLIPPRLIMPAVPTPFSHVMVAEEILQHEGLPAHIKEHLQAARPAFLLGNTAPDLGSLRRRARHETHFFQVPVIQQRPAHLRMLDHYAELADPDDLPRDQAAFIAGYLAHLWLDQAWILQVFQPFFGAGDLPGSFQERLIEHNLIRAAIDEEHRQHLPVDLSDILISAEPDSWLPFASDNSIRRWRDHLAEQVGPEGQIHTIEVFAEKLSMPSEDFSARLNSAKAMQRILARVPEDHIQQLFATAVEHSVELVHYYLEGRTEQAPRSSQPVHQLAVYPGDGEEAT